MGTIFSGKTVATGGVVSDFTHFGVSVFLALRSFLFEFLVLKDNNLIINQNINLLRAKTNDNYEFALERPVKRMV